MGVIFEESFEEETTLAQLLMKWTGAATTLIGTTYGRGGGKGAAIGTYLGDLIRTFAYEYGTLVAGVAYNTTFFGSNQPIYFSNISSSVHYGLFQVGDGRFKVGGQGRTSVSYSAPFSFEPLHTDVWYYLELKIYSVGLSAFSYQVRVNNHLIATGTITYDSAFYAGTDVNMNSVTFMGPGGGYNAHVDDIYVADDDFKGDITYLIIRPVSDVALASTPSTGSDGFEMVNDVGAPDSDTTYNELATATGRDEFELEDITLPTGAVIIAIQFNTICEKTDAGACSFKSGCNSGGTDVFGEEHFPSQDAYLDFMDVQVEQPGGGAWTEALINALHWVTERLT